MLSVKFRDFFITEINKKKKSLEKIRKKTISPCSLTGYVIKLVSTHFYILEKAFVLIIPDSLVDELINQRQFKVNIHLLE